MQRNVFPFFMIILFFLSCKDLFYDDKIYFSILPVIKKRKTFDKKRKNNTLGI